MQMTQIISVAGLVGFGAWAAYSSNDHPRAHMPLYVPQETVAQDLERRLEDLKRAWNPRVAQRVIEDARDRVDDLRRPLAWWIGRYRAPMLRQAIKLASELGVEEAHSNLTRLALTGPKDIRAFAIRHCAKIAEIPLDVVHELARDPDATVREAVVAAITPKTERALAELIRLLDDEARSVREAASHRMASFQDSGIRVQLQAIASGSGTASQSATLALGICGIDSTSEAVLISKLENRTDSPETDTILEALAQKTDPLRDAKPVLAIAANTSLPVTTRARALYCIERTRSVAHEELRKSTFFMHEPLCRYFAARAMISAGDVAGVRILVEVAKGANTKLSAAARRVLDEVTGLGSAARPAQFDAWLSKVGALPPLRLGDEAADLFQN